MSITCGVRTLQNWRVLPCLSEFFLYIYLPFCAKKYQWWKVTSTFTSVQPDYVFAAPVCPPLDCEDTIFIIYKRTLNICEGFLSNYERQFPVNPNESKLTISSTTITTILYLNTIWFKATYFQCGVVCLINWKFKNNRNMYRNSDNHYVFIHIKLKIRHAFNFQLLCVWIIMSH